MRVFWRRLSEAWEPYRPHKKLLTVFYWATALLALASGLTLLFPGLLGNMLTGFLDTLITNDAMLAVVKAVGTPALVIGSLLGVTGQRIYGERLGRIILWAYPKFFRFYFTVFVPATLLGIYGGTLDGRRLPVALALIVVVAGTCFIARVCYVFILPTELRERIAYSYYQDQLKPEKLNKKESDGRRQTVTKLANAVLCAQKEGDEVRVDAVRAVWESCMQMAPVDVAANALLAKDLWDILRTDGGQTPQRYQQLLLDILFTGQFATSPSEEDSLLMGLLLTEPFCEPGENCDWADACMLLRILAQHHNWSKQAPMVYSKVFWGLAMTMAVHSCYRTPADYNLMRELAGHLHITFSPAAAIDRRGLAAFVKRWRELCLEVSGLTDGVRVSGASLDYEDMRDGYLLEHVPNFSPQKKVSEEDDLLYLMMLLGGR